MSHDFLKRLIEAPGVAGYEAPAQQVWREYVAPFVSQIEEDSQGSLVAVLPGKGIEESIMLVGHIDEIGLLVKHVDENGFLRVAAVGGMKAASLPSQRVRVVSAKGIVSGVVGTFAAPKEKIEMKDLFIDIGADDREDALSRVELGDPIVVGEGWLDLDREKAAARCFDNRIGCYLVAEILRRLSAEERPMMTVLGVSAVQEETGGVGAGQVANRWKPHAAIAFDVTWATDYPTTSVEELGEIKLGKGPVLIRGVRTSQRLFESLRETARQLGIEWQLETETGRTYTDADAISTQHGGIPVSVVSVPCRYMHSTSEVIHLGDVEAIIRLLVAFLRTYEGTQ